MKRCLKKLSPLICIALFVGVIWVVFHATAEYPILGDPVSYPVNQLHGFELNIEEPSWSLFRGYIIRYKIQSQSKECFRMIWEGTTDYLHLEKLVNGQWYRLERTGSISDALNGEHLLGTSPESTTFHATFTQDLDCYGTRLEPGTYRLVLELTADDGSHHYLAAEFHVKNALGIR